MTAYETVIVERPEPRIARIVMNRPEARNAQNLQMTYDLNDAFDAAVQDDEVKVIILAGSGPHFAAGHGKCIAGGLMLAWACDLIVASSDAEFCDPVVTMGVCGVEWFVHPWELGPRKAKELLFTADVWSAQEAHRLGMVNHVVPRPELPSFVMALAQRIAAKPSFALKLTKEAVNRSVALE